jgi:hypothetical protein
VQVVFVGMVVGCGDEVPHQPADLRNAQRYELVAVGGVLPQA